MNLAYRTDTKDRRLGLLLTALVHAALLLGWQAARMPPVQAPAADNGRGRILWLPLPLPLRQAAAPDKAPAPPRKDASTQRPPARPATILAPPRSPAIAPTSEATPTPSAVITAPAQALDARPSAAQILERAKREIGSIAKALRKENNPYIAAPLDSPQMRLQQGIEHAHAMAPNRIWEAPKVEELVNNTGDGARRTRVITGNGTYCVTDRAPTTSIDMIEKHGKQRFTNCPEHEEPSKQQTWRTLRD